MASKKSTTQDFASDLIKSLNKEHGSKVAYNLAFDESPTHVKRWVSTGSRQLDYIVSNRPNGGLPVGRITELTGLEASGKSLVAAHVLAETQKKGGLAVYIDTENAGSVDFLEAIGVDLSKMVYVQMECLEDIFEAIEDMIIKVR